MKTAFYFTLKALFVLEIFQFLFWIFGNVGKRLDKTAKVIFKNYDSQAGKQTTAVHILPDISRSKGNQTIKLGQLIKFNMRNIFLKKSCTTCSRVTRPRPFLKKSKLNICLDQQSEVLYSLFLLYAQLEDYQTILKLRC